MKLILAFVQPFKVPELVDVLRTEAGFPGMTVLHCEGFGRESMRSQRHDPATEVSDFTPGRVILVACPDDQAELVTRRIAEVAHTGRKGDGMVLSLPLEAALRIASGDQGEDALR